MEKQKLTIGELAEVSGVRLSTLKFYTEKGLLEYEQADRGLRRYYDKDRALKRLSEIKELKKKRLTLEEIIKILRDSKIKV